MKQIIFISYLLVTMMFFYSCSFQPKIEENKIKRLALVIGNQNYNKDNSLENPINDAKGIANRLEDIGFDVILGLDFTLAELNEALANLKAKIEPDNSMVFIYFAGHGNTLKKNPEETYLMMTDKKEKTLVSIYKLYAFLEDAKARYNIISIDACRDYQKQYIVMEKESNEKTLKNFRGNIRFDEGDKADESVVLDNKYSYKMPGSTIVSYATMPYQRAKDWSIYDEEHSPYAYALMKYLDDEEIPIEEVFRRVRVDLLKETGRSQSNLEVVNLEKNIWLVPKRAGISFAPPI